MDPANIRYVSNVKQLGPEDKRGVFCISMMLKIKTDNKELAEDKELDDEEELDDEDTETNPFFLVTKIEFIWDDKTWLRNIDRFNTFVDRLEHRIERDYDNIRQVAISTMEIKYHRRTNTVEFWSCSSPFIENYFPINDELIQALKKMGKWLNKNKEMSEKLSTQRTVLKIGLDA